MSTVPPMPKPVRVARRPFGEFSVEVEVYKTEVGYTSLGKVKKSDSRTSVGFAGPELTTIEAALEAGFESGERRIAKGFDTAW